MMRKQKIWIFASLMSILIMVCTVWVVYASGVKIEYPPLELSPSQPPETIGTAGTTGTVGATGTVGTTDTVGTPGPAPATGTTITNMPTISDETNHTGLWIGLGVGIFILILVIFGASWGMRRRRRRSSVTSSSNIPLSPSQSEVGPDEQVRNQPPRPPNRTFSETANPPEPSRRESNRRSSNETTNPRNPPQEPLRKPPTQEPLRKPPTQEKILGIINILPIRQISPQLSEYIDLQTRKPFPTVLQLNQIALDFGVGIVETQESAYCGVHALNNLFQVPWLNVSLAKDICERLDPTQQVQCINGAWFSSQVLVEAVTERISNYAKLSFGIADLDLAFDLVPQQIYDQLEVDVYNILTTENLFIPWTDKDNEGKEIPTIKLNKDFKPNPNNPKEVEWKKQLLNYKGYDFASGKLQESSAPQTILDMLLRNYIQIYKLNYRKANLSKYPPFVGYWNVSQDIVNGCLGMIVSNGRHWVAYRNLYYSNGKCIGIVKFDSQHNSPSSFFTTAETLFSDIYSFINRNPLDAVIVSQQGSNAERIIHGYQAKLPVY